LSWSNIGKAARECVLDEEAQRSMEGFDDKGWPGQTMSSAVPAHTEEAEVMGNMFLVSITCALACER
jgi:hypothetical protein